MTANKHTPGPWELRNEFGMQGLIYPKGSQYPVASTTGYFTAAGHTAANARLIASAPELLEALSAKVNDAEQRVFEDWLESKSPSGDHEQVQRHWLESSDYRDFVAEWGDQLAAIAKATGGAA